jgi:hypothetical protein
LSFGPGSQWHCFKFDKQFLKTGKMKKYFIPALLTLSGLALTTCDKVDPPYKEVDNSVDTTECPIPAFPVKSEHHKVVLMEEYTGHKCVYCPSGAAVAHDMEGAYGDSIIVIAIHAGGFAEPESPDLTLDLRCNVGDDLHSNYGITNNPAGIFNRKNINGTLVYEGFTNWETTFLAAVDTLPLLDMQIINNYNESQNKVCIHVQTEYLVNIDRPLKLALYIVEDSIIGTQWNNNPTIGPIPKINDYVFMNVLRGSVNGTWGNDLSTATMSAGAKIVSSYKLILNSSWNPDHCSIVAFIYYSNTGEVLAAVRGKVKL